MENFIFDNSIFFSLKTTRSSDSIDSSDTKIGNKNGDVVNGTFTNSSGLQVIFSGDRTL